MVNAKCTECGVALQRNKPASSIAETGGNPGARLSAHSSGPVGSGGSGAGRSLIQI